MSELMDGEITPEISENATNLVFAEVRKLCEKHEAGPEFVIRNLRRLAKFRGRKAFLPKGNIIIRGVKKGKKVEEALSAQVIYSKLLDFPDIQLGATKELAAMQDMYSPVKVKNEHRYPEGPPVQINTLSPKEIEAIDAGLEAYERKVISQKV